MQTKQREQLGNAALSKNMSFYSEACDPNLAFVKERMANGGGGGGGEVTKGSGSGKVVKGSEELPITEEVKSCYARHCRYYYIVPCAKYRQKNLRVEVVEFR